MPCNSTANITFQIFSDSGNKILEIRPRSVQFDRKAGSFDICKAEFAQDVADHIQPRFETEGSILRQPHSANILIDGDSVHRLIYVPDGVWFSDNSVHIEFHDAQKILTRGVIDWRSKTDTLKEAYEYIFKNRREDGPNVFNGIKFAIPDRKIRDYYTDDAGEFTIDGLSKIEDGTVSEKQLTFDIIGSRYVHDFDKMSPHDCILELNNAYGLETWTGTDGYLWVGSRYSKEINHIAAEDDNRFWRITDYNVREARDPVVKSVVRGGWAVNPDMTNSGVSPDIENLNIGTEKFRMEGVAEIDSDSILGQEITNEIKESKQDSLEAVAKQMLKNKQRDQATGNIEFNPDFSGNQHTDIRFVQIGDKITTYPPEETKCGSNVQKETFDVTGVQHSLTSDGNWSIRLDVMKQANGAISSNIKTKLRYYDPANERYLTEDEYSAKVGL